MDKKLKKGVTTWGWAWARVFVTHDPYPDFRNGTVSIDMLIKSKGNVSLWAPRISGVDPSILYANIEPESVPDTRQGWCGPRLGAGL